jgi:hypothetical protein
MACHPTGPHTAWDESDMINTIFDACVQLLLTWAGVLGMSYKAINVWLFVFLWPLATLALIGLVLYQRIQIRGLRKRLDKL